MSASPTCGRTLHGRTEEERAMSMRNCNTTTTTTTTTNNKPTMFVLLLALMLAPTLTQAATLKKWDLLGPFAVGKTEYDADPGFRLAHPDANHHSDQQPATATAPPNWRYGEQVPGGHVRWRRIAADRSGWVGVAFPEVPWNQLVGAMDGVAVAEVQAWVRANLTIKRGGMVRLHCPGLHNIELHASSAPAPSSASSSGSPPRIFQADIYHSQLVVAAAELPVGRYQLRARVRGKAQLRFRCELLTSDAAAPLAAALTDARPDVIDGRLFGGRGWLGVAVSNLLPRWEEVEVLLPGPSERQLLHGQPKGVRVVLGQETTQTFRLAPGQTRVLPVSFTLATDTGVGEARLPRTQEKDDCVRVAVVVASRSSGQRLPLTTSLRCRTTRQSFLFSFRDADGSVAHAAAILPQQPCPQPRGCPVVLAFSGVGVTPGAQADSHKYDAGDGRRAGSGVSYRFGFDGAWLVCPERDGAHNWEGIGHESGKAALRHVAQHAGAFDATRAADSTRCLYTGHSRGGHGAMMMAVHQPDTSLGLLAAAGWYRREQYGDANMIFGRDVQLDFLDPVLRGLLEASIVENDCAISAPNLLGSQVMLRTGGSDESVPPWHTRRYARVLQTHGVDVHLSEIPGKPHFWWDTAAANDGGAVFDPEMRAFLHARLAESVPAGGQLPAVFELVCSNPATYSARGGLRVLAQAIPMRQSRIRVQRRAGEWRLQTRNVLRFSLDCHAVPVLQLAKAERPAVLVVDGVRLDAGEGCQHAGPEREQEPAQLVVVQSDAGWQVAQADIPPAGRSPTQLGPMRQVFQRPFAVVVGTTGSAEETASNMDLAVYLANSHFLAHKTAVEIINDTALLDGHLAAYAAPRPNLVLVAAGGHHRLLADMGFAAVEWVSQAATAIAGTSCARTLAARGDGFALAALAPRPPLDGDHGASHGDGLVLVLASHQASSLAWLYRAHSFASQVPLTRALFSNMLPDFVVAGPRFPELGYAGVTMAGYLGDNWQPHPQAAYVAC